ncbi:MAG: TonB family protein [bacterium]|nr:TonB family protein [bacterium]
MQIRILAPIALALASIVLSCASVPTRDVLPNETVAAPKPISRPPFQIPAQLLQSESEARITLDMMVEGSGRVSDVRVLNSEPEGALDRNASRAARRWRYEAPVVDGVRVRRRTEPVTVYLFINRCPDPGPGAGDHIKICAQTLP